MNPKWQYALARTKPKPAQTNLSAMQRIQHKVYTCVLNNKPQKCLMPYPQAQCIHPNA